MWWASTHDPLSFPPENGNRYEGNWQRGVKNGSGRFFHLDHGQLFEGFWVDDVAKCGTMIDFGRDEAPQPTQFPIPEVGSSLQDPGTTPNLTGYYYIIIDGERTRLVACFIGLSQE